MHCRVGRLSCRRPSQELSWNGAYKKSTHLRLRQRPVPHHQRELSESDPAVLAFWDLVSWRNHSSSSDISERRLTFILVPVLGRIPQLSKSFKLHFWFQFVIILELILLSPQILCAPQRHPPDLKTQRRRPTHTRFSRGTPPDRWRRATGRAVSPIM